MPKDHAGKTGLCVVRTRGGWALRKIGSTRATKTYRTQSEAAKAAMHELRTKGGELRIQGKNGRWRDSFTVGSNAMRKLGEIEGIHPSRDVEGAFREFDRKGLSPKARRAAIARQFGKRD
jgi:hypothetical protein